MFEKDGTAESSDISRFLVRGEVTMTARNCAPDELAVAKAVDGEAPVKKRERSELQGEDCGGNVFGAPSKGDTVDHRGRENSPYRFSGQGFGGGGIEAFLVHGKKESDGPAQRDEDQRRAATQKPDHRDIRRFFEGRDKATTSSSTFSSQIEGHNRCSKCGLQIPDAELVEHQDFHFAVELQDEERKRVNPLNVAIRVPSSGVEQKRNIPGAEERDEVETKRRKRELFFQPRSTG